MALQIGVFSLILAFCLNIYFLLKIIFTKRKISDRLSQGGKSIHVDKSIEAKMMIKKNPAKKKRVINRFEKALAEASIEVDPKKFITLSLLSTIFLVLIVFIITGSLLSLIILIIVPMFIKLFLNYLKKKRIKLFASQLKDVVEFLASSLKTGYSLMQALNMIVHNGQPPSSVEFERVISEINLGKSYEEAFDKMFERNPIDEIEILSAAVAISKETGGNLSHILETVAETIRQREKLTREVKTLTAQGRLSGIILALVPFGIFLCMMIINPEYTKLLITHPLGQKMLAGGIISQIIGAIFIKKIIKIDG